MNGQLRGSCLCGATTYTVPDAFEYALYCHCADCRRATGAAAKPFAALPAARLALIQGHETLLRHGGESAHDVHCGQCGSLLYSIVRDGMYAHVTLGTLIDSPTIRPTAHIFVASKAPWDTICDDLPQFAQFPPE